jgi:hypothetical protein
MSTVTGITHPLVNAVGTWFGDDTKEPIPPTPPPGADAPEVLAARKKQEEMERQRRGRRSTIMTSGTGVAEDPAVLGRPAASGSRLFGQL